MTEYQEIVEDHPIRDIEKTFGFLAALHGKLVDIADSLDDDTFAVDMYGDDPNGASGVITTQLGVGAPIFRNYNGPYVIETILATWGVGSGNQVDGTGTTATPAAGALITSVTPGAIGLWQVQWTIEVQGAAATLVNNYTLNSPLATAIATADQPAAIGNYPQQPQLVNITSVGQSILVRTTATETTATITATLTATPVNPSGASIASLQLGSRILQLGSTGIFNPQGLHIQMDRDDSVIFKTTTAEPCHLEINGHIDRRVMETRNRK